ncbi:class I SAM-dependent methyltransferase [Desulfofustis glycolicus]|uniref:Methyltransferase domain-containing protein n=1 Tax=Desulfofustis glycolicus DSM 9705 TaxID=1121409 RepID=A0A1M5YBL6_9BACT|nr:class I SAM-dependent methyltransferase [Desulfofustis glycolicus]MCB2217742.1 class I SAM-dependent methyltransferase [Desulfobulbaceae bacterium]SHI09417.1 Methyltransferase domain-containing protein [Desulfofustis glycolicus DSM 9705]
MSEKRFNPKKLHKLNNPKRLHDLPPDYLWAKADLQATEVLVDIGAGTGFFSIPFVPLTKRLYACDISEIMLDWLRENVCPHYPSIIPVKMEMQAVPLPDQLADLVYMINLHHELDDPAILLRECWRLLKDGGKLLIVDWKKQEMAEGPPAQIRCLPSKVKDDVVRAGFRNGVVDEALAKHFLLVAEK